MNNYLKILEFLERFAGDTELHNIHSFLNDLGLTTKKQKESILVELARSEYLTFDGGTKGGEIWFGKKKFGGFYEKDYEARITLLGLTYLDQQRQKNMKFSLNGNNNQVVLYSNDVKINADTKEVISNILTTLERDKSITAEQQTQYLEAFNTLLIELTDQQVKPSTWQSILSIGDNVSSISSLLIQLGSLIPIQ